MPRNPDKKKCKAIGCKAWAKRGEEFCSSHLHSAIADEGADLLVPLLQAMDRAVENLPSPDVEVINEELRNLFRSRAMYLRWLQRLRDEVGNGHINPTQVLRAWNDSTTRLLQLLRARRALGGTEMGDLAELLDSAFSILEKAPPEGGDRGGDP